MVLISALCCTLLTCTRSSEDEVISSVHLEDTWRTLTEADLRTELHLPRESKLLLFLFMPTLAYTHTYFCRPDKTIVCKWYIDPTTQRQNRVCIAAIFLYMHSSVTGTAGILNQHAAHYKDIYLYSCLSSNCMCAYINLQLHHIIHFLPLVTDHIPTVLTISCSLSHLPSSQAIFPSTPLPN